jgi:hypothetical protein
VIATTSSGRRFAALARYLLHGRSGEESERVAWTAGRHLGLDDPELAAVLMQATADQNVRVEAPVYHLTLSFDPQDAVTQAQMEAAVDRVLADLGLTDHQALLVAHQDRAHPHVHVMVNRVHPETATAWERWQDRPRIEHTLRELERELGLREVRGRLYQLEGQELPERALLTSGEHHQALRTGEQPFPDRVRDHLAEFRGAQSWPELQERLAAHGLRLERKGQGLVITDGEHRVKASRVARDLSLLRLEQRFGVPFPGRERAIAEREQSADVRQLRGAVEEVARVDAITQEQARVYQELETVRQQGYTLERATTAHREADGAFGRALQRVYAKPDLARAQIETAAGELGAARARELLATEPERFGPLHAVKRPHVFGLITTYDDTAARGDARQAAVVWKELVRTEGELTNLTRAHVPDGQNERTAAWAARATEHLKAATQQMHGRINELGEELGRLPNRELLQHSIGRVLVRLEPWELTQLRALLTCPQRAILFHGRRLARDIAFGRYEEREMER